MKASHDEKAILSTSILEQLPAVDEAAVDRLLAAEIRANRDVWIVLDDDPTGTQTVHDVSVYTDWSVQSIASGLREGRKVVYLLTNSRSMSREETASVHQEIARNVMQASAETGVRAVIMSRSDSTLRGHYPLETEQLRQCLESSGQAIDGEVLCPFFKEGGRYTLHGIHYVRDGERLIPAAPGLYCGEDRRTLSRRAGGSRFD